MSVPGSPVPVSLRCRCWGEELLQLFFFLAKPPSEVSWLKNMAACPPKSGLTLEETGTTEMMRRRPCPPSSPCLITVWSTIGENKAQR